MLAAKGQGLAPCCVSLLCFEFWCIKEDLQTNRLTPSLSSDSRQDSRDCKKKLSLRITEYCSHKVDPGVPFTDCHASYTNLSASYMDRCTASHTIHSTSHPDHRCMCAWVYLCQSVLHELITVCHAPIRQCFIHYLRPHQFFAE